MKYAYFAIQIITPGSEVEITRLINAMIMEGYEYHSAFSTGWNHSYSYLLFRRPV